MSHCKSYNKKEVLYKSNKVAKGKKNLKQENLPTPGGVRIVPRISPEMRNKAAKAVAAKERKDNKNAKKLVMDEDEFDNMVNVKEEEKSFGEGMGFNPDLKTRQKPNRGQKVSSIQNGRGLKKKNPWEDSDEDESIDENEYGLSNEESDIEDSPPPPRKKSKPTPPQKPKRGVQRSQKSAESDVEYIDDSD